MFLKSWHSLFSVLLVGTQPNLTGAVFSRDTTNTTASSTANVEAAFTALQTWYDDSNGLWNTTGWWNSANCITVLGDLAAVDSRVKSHVTSVLANTFVEAQKYNLQQTKIITADFNIQTVFGNVSMPAGVKSNLVINPQGFINGFYDDEGWWALGWIQAYDLTGNSDYLVAATDIFANMKNGSTTPCDGGIWWDKAETYVNAIANTLYLSVASHLANRIPIQKSYYVSIAQDQLSWFLGSGMLNSNSLINDGLDATCKNNNGTVWSYNQGVILGALVELNTASPNSTYLPLAKSIATAAIKALSDSNGILHDPCEPNCGGDGSQFKGVFMRNLQILQQASPETTYLNFIAANAASIWAKDRNSLNQLDVDWAGPFASADASKQSSAMDALVAAVAFQGQMSNGLGMR